MTTSPLPTPDVPAEVPADVQGLLDMLEQVFPKFEDFEAAELRVVLGAAPPGPAAPTDVVKTDHQIANGPMVRSYVPPAATAATPIVLYFHGGGWTIGDIAGFDDSVTGLAESTGFVFVSVEYRLAPEHPFPAAVDDVETVIRWAASGALGAGNPERLAVAGDSAGGNLAAVGAILARDHGLPVTHQLLLYPALDPSRASGSYRQFATGKFLTDAMMEWFWIQYLGSGAVALERMSDWRVNPARATSFDGVASATVITAGLDPLRDEGEAYAHQMAAAGVPVTIRRYEGLIHGFMGFGAILPEVGVARAEIAALLREALDG
jgi:acetyl esterase